MMVGSESRIQTCYSIFSIISSFQQEEQQPQQNETCKETKKCDPYSREKKQPIETISKCF